MNLNRLRMGIHVPLDQPRAVVNTVTNFRIR
jgi:hypothetical protein